MRKINALGWFTVALFIIGFGGLIAIGRSIWYENKILFLTVAISLPLAFFLYKKVNEMDRELKRKEGEEAQEEYEKNQS